MKIRHTKKLDQVLRPVISSLLSSATLGLSLLGAPAAFADDAVQLKVLVVSAGSETEDLGLAYIKPTLDEMGVPYDILDARTTMLTAATLSPDGCTAAAKGCVGNYNGIILTSTDLGQEFTPSEWEILHQYEEEFQVRESILSGWPGTYWDPNPPWGIYLDYGLTYATGGTFPNAQWTGSAGGHTVFEYINTDNPLPITDWAFATNPRDDGIGPRDGTVPKVEPLLTTENGDVLVSIVRYYLPDQPKKAVREVMLSTITNAPYLIHSQALAYEFINFATQGVFVGGRHVHMTAHLDDLFIPNELWNIDIDETDPNLTYRLNRHDIRNAAKVQYAFRADHPTIGNDFKLDFPFNGAGAVLDPTAKYEDLIPNLSDDLVAAVVEYKYQFRFINHTFTHADMDKPPASPNALCDYETLPTVEAIMQEITKNRRVWYMLRLPEWWQNFGTLVTGNHSGLKDRNCTDYPELHPEMVNVQSDDVPFWKGANPLFLKAAAKTGVKYIASDSSQANQDVEQYISQVDDGSPADRIMLPRWPANVFYNVINPEQMTDEYNYIFHQRFLNNGQDPCTVPGAICTPRDYDAILAAESDTALRHMLSFKKWSHFFHQTNLADYDGNGNTLMYDWLQAVVDEYEKLFTLPIKNLPYYQLGRKTRASLNARSADINAIWNRTTNMVTLSANKYVPYLLVTGLEGGELYGGQYIWEDLVMPKPRTLRVNQASSQ